MAELDVRSLVESAYNDAEASGGDGSEAVPDVVAVGDSQVAEAPAGTSEASGDDGGSEPAAPPKADRARDEKGKFAPKPKEGQALKPAASKAPAVAEGASGGPPTTDSSQLPATPPVPVAEVTKAPQGLTPAEREAYAKAPPEIQKALARMDQTARQSMQESAPARQLAQAFKETVSPYVGMMHAAGAQNPIQAVGGILQQWAVLQSGDVQSKASLIASLIGRTGVPLDVINQHLGGNGQQGQEPQAFDPVAFRQQMKQELMQDLQGQRQQAMQNRALQEVEAFIADPKNEWADDLREETSALMTAAAARGKTLTIQDAHQQAIWSNPETRAILQARQKQEAAKASIASTQQARIAASSVKSTPSTGASSTRAPKTDRERVEAAYDSLDGR